LPSIAQDDNLVVIMTTPQRLAEVFRVLGPLYREAAQRVAQDEHIEQVTTGVRAVLEQLYVDGDQTVPVIARAVGTSRQYIQRMADEATAARLVRYVENPLHRRSALVQLTRRGDETISRILLREHGALSSAARDLSDRDIDACIRVLKRLRAGLHEGALAESSVR
jgi:DNA-binding MarR family transcriptional regulator